MDNSFNPREVTLLAHVIEQACTALGCCDEAAKATIAARVVAYASRGERDFEVLLSAAMGGKEPPRVPDKKRIRLGKPAVSHLYVQAERARKLASECNTSPVADLLELHARLCEQNAEARQRLKKRRTIPG